MTKRRRNILEKNTRIFSKVISKPGLGDNRRDFARRSFPSITCGFFRSGRTIRTPTKTRIKRKHHNCESSTPGEQRTCSRQKEIVDAGFLELVRPQESAGPMIRSSWIH